MWISSLLMLTPLLASLACYFLKPVRLQYAVSLGMGFAHLAFSLLNFTGLYRPDLPPFFSDDALSRLFLLILSNVFFWVVLVSFSYLKKRNPDIREDANRYFALLNLYLFTNTAAILSNHFGMFWVSAEATTLSTVPLIYYYRNPKSLEAMWKYLFLISIGVAFAFIGILFLTLSAKGTPLEGHQLFFSDFRSQATALNPIWLKACFIFVFVGLGTKIGIAPMHFADIVATSNSPTPVAALMSGSLRLVALLGVMRMLQIIIPTSSYPFARTLMIIGALLSIGAAFFYMFRAADFRQMLAFSSVEHLGIITLGVAVGGAAFIGALYHAVYNSLNKIVLFLLSGNIHHAYKTRNAGNVFSVLNLLPWTGWIFLFAFFAISGIPPFGVFFSEIRIFEGILFSGQPWILGTVLVLMTFIFINMGRVIFGMLYRAPEADSPAVESETFSLIHFSSIALLVILMVLGVVVPDVLRETILTIAQDFGVRP